jgi:hypothetical protein
VTWKVTVKCYWGKIVRGKFISSGVPAVVAFMHVRMALYRNGTQVGQSSRDKPAVSYLTVPVAGGCTRVRSTKGGARPSPYCLQA